VKFISGGTILGDGSIALIIDTAAIARKVNSDIYGIDQDFSSLEKARKLLAKNKDIVENDEIHSEEIAEPFEKMNKIKKKKIEGRRPSALIVDDSISVRKFVASVLNKNNYKTVLTSNGEEALHRLKGGNFDIIITDLEMPKMHGFDLIEDIRKDVKYNDLPIIILTGRAGQKQKEKGMELGANAFIVKPFKEGDLLSILDDFIESESIS
jgi:chemosensory pili system protein ChpA (sensor histidine kinase/response regulator)